MSELDALRTGIMNLLRQRKERTGSIRWMRMKSRTATTKESLINHVILFEQWGFMDYIAARTLLLKGLDASVKPELPRRKFSSANALQECLQETDRMYHGNLITAGELAWPACALAATAVEKYCKAIIAVSQKQEPKHSHLTSALIKQVGHCVKNLFSVINQQFLIDLGLVYGLRYHTNVPNDPCLWEISMRGVLAELDFTISRLDSCVQITINGVVPFNSSYVDARLLGSQDLHRENYVLLGKDKDAFWRQHDLKCVLSTITGPDNPERGGIGRTNKPSDKFFSIVRTNIPKNLEMAQVRKDERDNMRSLLKREAEIMHYVPEKPEKGSVR